MKVILASASPRRKELLKLVIPEFEVKGSEIEEKVEENLTVEEQVTGLAYLKAKYIFDKTEGDRMVIGADTIVAKNGKIYGKPKDKEDAKNMIKELLQDDNIHSVITGLAVISEIKGKIEEYKTFDEVKVFLTDISDEEIENWIATGKAMDKAGAYAIQDEFGVFVEKIEGNHSTVVGLPIHKVYEIMKKIKNRNEIWKSEELEETQKGDKEEVDADKVLESFYEHYTSVKQKTNSKSRSQIMRKAIYEYNSNDELRTILEKMRRKQLKNKVNLIGDLSFIEDLNRYGLDIIKGMEMRAKKRAENRATRQRKLTLDEKIILAISAGKDEQYIINLMESGNYNELIILYSLGWGTDEGKRFQEIHTKCKNERNSKDSLHDR